MRLVFIHGRAQGKRTPAELEAEWGAAIDQGFANAGKERPADLQIVLPFYGARLDALTANAQTKLARIIERGDPGTEPAVDPFALDLLLAIARGAGIGDSEMSAELPAGVLQRGPESWEWVQAVGRLIDRRLPWFAEFTVARFTADVHAYVTRKAVRTAIHELLRPALVVDEPSVVVAHSLGTVVAYWLLNELGDEVQVPLFVTLGSPLGIEVIKDRLPRPLGMPQGVARWVNAADERDPIALHSRLERPRFPADIENISDLQNPHDHPHGIKGYLADPKVASRIHDALTVLS
ncbi:MAG: hypothetical protein AB7I09_18170 [Planctomycetota bacterium]